MGMKINIEISGDANALRIFSDIESVLKNQVYKLEFVTETKTIKVEKN